MVTVQHGSEHVCVHKCEERQRKKKRCSQAELPQTSSLASFMSFSQVSQQNWLQLKTPGLTFSQLQS